MKKLIAIIFAILITTQFCYAGDPFREYGKIHTVSRINNYLYENSTANAINSTVLNHLDSKFYNLGFVAFTQGRWEAIYPKCKYSTAKGALQSCMAQYGGKGPFLQKGYDHFKKLPLAERLGYLMKAHWIPFLIDKEVSDSERMEFYELLNTIGYPPSYSRQLIELPLTMWFTEVELQKLMAY
jgi:hypothetical protein